MVILKPATETPVVAVHLGGALDDAGLPGGVLGLAVGRTSEIVEALLSDGELGALSFTGSTAVGRQLRRQLADTNVRLQTEMAARTPRWCSPTPTSSWPPAQSRPPHSARPGSGAPPPAGWWRCGRWRTR